MSGASAITNVTAGAYADIPVFVFHLLEYAGVEFDLDVDEINDRWEELAAADQMESHLSSARMPRWSTSTWPRPVGGAASMSSTVASVCLMIM